MVKFRRMLQYLPHFTRRVLYLKWNSELVWDKGQNERFEDRRIVRAAEPA